MVVVVMVVVDKGVGRVSMIFVVGSSLLLLLLLLLLMLLLLLSSSYLLAGPVYECWCA